MADNVYDQNWAELESDLPINNFAELTQVPGEEWLPKTDWCCDRIIANDD